MKLLLWLSLLLLPTTLLAQSTSLSYNCPSGQQGVPWTCLPIVIGVASTPPYTFSLRKGTMPDWMSIDTSTGRLRGTPTYSFEMYEGQDNLLNFQLLLIHIRNQDKRMKLVKSSLGGLDPPLTVEQMIAAMARVHKEKYPHRVLDAFDQFVGAIIGLQDDQTISSATEIAARKKEWYRVFAVTLNTGLDLIQRSHGQLAQAGDLERANELIATDAAALTNETGVQVIPETGGVKLTPKKP